MVRHFPMCVHDRRLMILIRLGSQRAYRLYIDFNVFSLAQCALICLSACASVCVHMYSPFRPSMTDKCNAVLPARV